MWSGWKQPNDGDLCVHPVDNEHLIMGARTNGGRCAVNAITCMSISFDSIRSHQILDARF